MRCTRERSTHSMLSSSCRITTGALVPAFTYVANPDMVRPNLKPTRDYLAHLLAANDVLPVTYLDDVRAVECWA